MKTKSIAIIYAVTAAALYAVNVPFSKILMKQVEPTMMAAFLYLGAGAGLFMYGLVEDALGIKEKRESLTRKELPYTVAMVLLDIAAPILLMVGITMTNSANVSLLQVHIIPLHRFWVWHLVCCFCTKDRKRHFTEH